jgi:glutamate-1-semialdehyde 2,1-aminomutase
MNDESIKMTNTETALRSAALYARACKVIPGGVNSPVRAFRAVGGQPLFIARGTGKHVYDADGREYLDLMNSWGALILGHAHPQVIAAIEAVCRNGTTFGAPCAAEVDLAEWITAAYGLEQVRFVSSGTEAVMSAIRLARAATNRDIIVKFVGCYHGHVDHLLVSAGSGLATFGHPSSAGVPESAVAATRVLPLNDIAALQKLFALEGQRIAAVIVEPLPANQGLVLQHQKFMHELRTLTQKSGSLLIFDEVISGFRLAKGGMAQVLGIKPDIATFGKVIGGGMPVGAFAAARQIMKNLAPEGAAYQAGTLSGNPVAMTAGLTTLNLLQQQSGWEQLEKLGLALDQALRPVVAGAPFPMHVVRQGSLFWLVCQEKLAPHVAPSLDEIAKTRFAKLFHAMLARGVYLPPSPYEVCFLSLAHTTQDMRDFADKLAVCLALAADAS